MRTIFFVCASASLVAFGCKSGGTNEATPAHASSAAPQAPVHVMSSRIAESPSVAARMQQHEKHAALLRDSVARGDLASARREARVLADLKLDASADRSWTDPLTAMNAAAAQLADADTQAEASRALARLALTCADCHAQLGRPGSSTFELERETWGVEGHMTLLHHAAALQMWDGLVVPSDDSWNAGARALSGAPLAPELLTPGKTPVPRVGELASHVHELARKATTANDRVTRADLFGQMMTTCATCHQWLGGGP
jgi:mono/diheme cytochrome c family protein